MKRSMRFLTFWMIAILYAQITHLNVAMAQGANGEAINRAGSNAGDPNKNKLETKAEKQHSPTPPLKTKATSPKPAAESPSYLAKICSIAPSNDGGDVAKLIGNPTPFTVKARDARTVLIYGPKVRLNAADSNTVEKICGDIRSLATPPATTEEVPVTHYGALGDLAARAKALNYPGITVQAAGDNKLRINRASWVTDNEYDGFKKDLLDMALRLKAVPPTSQLFYISAADAASALGTSKSDKTDKTAGTKNSSSGGASTTVTVDTTATQTVGDNPCVQPAKTVPGSDKSAADSTSSSVVNPNTGCDSSGTAKGGETKDSANSAAKKPSVSISTLSPDLLVFGVDNPGDDAQIAEKKRILAALDFPRPEVIINTFSFQTSASESRVLTEGARALEVEVGRYNDAIQMALNRTWLYLQCRANEATNSPATPCSQTYSTSPEPLFFDQDFLNYLTLRFVADQPQNPAYQASAESPTKDISLKLPDETRKTLGVCPATQYCLGYTSLFKPLRLNLTDMLLAVISSNDPATEIRTALRVMENANKINEIRLDTPSEQQLKRCNYDCAKRPELFPSACDLRDVYILRKADVDLNNRSGAKQYTSDHPSDEIAKEAVDSSFMPLFCFDEEIESAFPKGSGGNNAARLLRSTLANFLFQYKTSQEYPHDFSPYLLSQSAQALNSQLNPLIVAFNRDLAAALRPLEDLADFTNCGNTKCNSGKNGFWFWQGHDTRFVNNGIITVRTVSGKETTVDTVTQNFFDATDPPSITDLINSVGQAESNVPKVLKANLTADEAAVIIGALNSVKPATAKVGREFKIDITPHSLSGASAAELDLQMVTGDQADPTRYSGGKSDPDNLSRIAHQTTNTKVRLESIKLFDISSFSASLQRSRKNVPIIPPGFEIPYIGSVLSLPVPGGMQFHRSTAVMSAVVVPTAADLASGLEFVHDRVLNSRVCNTSGNAACMASTAYSVDDSQSAPIWEYNRQKVQCFATGGTLCGSLSFGDLLLQ